MFNISYFIQTIIIFFLYKDRYIDILRLGPDFNSQFTTNKNNHIFEIVKELEANLIKFPEKCHDELRHRILSISSKYLKKSTHNSDLDKSIEKGIKLKREFLKNNKELLVTKADKGNITVILNKQNYLDKMQNLLDDSSTYEKIDLDPLQKSQKSF